MVRMSPAIFGSAAAGSWWDDINNSPEWQRDVFFVLMAAYAAVSAIALIQLIRIQMRVPEFRWTTQKIFLLMNFIVCGVRATVFGFHTQVFLFKTKVITLVLLYLPGLLFFSTYTLLVLFWAEIYYQALNSPRDLLRSVYIGINGSLYAIQFGIWMYLSVDNNIVFEVIGTYFVAGISLLAFLGFVIYGGKLFSLLNRYPNESRGRQKKLREVGSVTVICLTCFLIRCCVALGAAFDADLSLEVVNHPILDLLYYVLTEIVPSALVLFILRKLPPRRVSQPPPSGATILPETLK